MRESDDDEEKETVGFALRSSGHHSLLSSSWLLALELTAPMTSATQRNATQQGCSPLVWRQECSVRRSVCYLAGRRTSSSTSDRRIRTMGIRFAVGPADKERSGRRVAAWPLRQASLSLWISACLCLARGDRRVANKANRLIYIHDSGFTGGT